MSVIPRKKSAAQQQHPIVGVGNEGGSSSARKRKAGGAGDSKFVDRKVNRGSKHGKIDVGAPFSFEEPLVLFGGRTLPGETARNLIAGSSNPRVFGEAEGKAPGDPMSRKAWFPSKTQFANVIAKCLPRTDVFRFHHTWKTVLSAMKGKPVPDDPVFLIPGNAQLLNTNVQVIHRTFVELYGSGNVSLSICDHMNEGVDVHSVSMRPDYLEIVMMDAVIARTVRVPRRRTGKELVDTPVKLRVQPEFLDAKYDKRYRCLVVVLPEAGAYYCHREKRHESVGVPNTHIPMDMNWLRIVRNGSKNNRFARGSYISRLWDGNADKIWKWRISRGSSNFVLNSVAMGPVARLLPFPGAMKKIMYARQCPDEEGPRLAPDHVEGADYAMVEKRYLRRAYNAGLEASPSAKRGCRHYVSGFLHRVISRDDSLVIDPSEEGDVDVCVSVQVNHPGSLSGKMSVSRDSIVQIRYLPTLGPAADLMLDDINRHARTVRSRNQGSARAGKGDLGSMHPIGTRICLDGVRRTRYVTSSEEGAESLLRDAVVASANLAAVSIPAVLRTMQDLEADGGVIPRHGMAGDNCLANITNTMDVSVDLANASHYDVNDASQGFSIWTEDEPGSTKDWYFVLPNVYGKRNGNGPTYNGMAIRLRHGVMISWDGRLIRHCTSMMRRAEGKHVYGTFFAAKTAIVRYGTRKASASYRSFATLEAAELKAKVVQLHGDLDVAVATLEEAKRSVGVADRSVRDLNKLLMEAERSLAIACDDARAKMLTAGGSTPIDLVSAGVHRAESLPMGVAAEPAESFSVGLVVRGGAESDADMDVDDTSTSVPPDEDAESWVDNSLASVHSDEGSVDFGIDVEPFDEGDITNPVRLDDLPTSDDDVAVVVSILDATTGRAGGNATPAMARGPVPDVRQDDNTSSGLFTRSCGEVVEVATPSSRANADVALARGPVLDEGGDDTSSGLLTRSYGEVVKAATPSSRANAAVALARGPVPDEGGDDNGGGVAGRCGKLLVTPVGCVAEAPPPSSIHLPISRVDSALTLDREDSPLLASFTKPSECGTNPDEWDGSNPGTDLPGHLPQQMVPRSGYAGGGQGPGGFRRETPRKTPGGRPPQHKRHDRMLSNAEVQGHRDPNRKRMIEKDVTDRGAPTSNLGEDDVTHESESLPVAHRPLQDTPKISTAAELAPKDNAVTHTGCLGYLEDTRLCDVKAGFGASAMCNMMWSLRNPGWMPEAMEYDVRHAHPLGVCKENAPKMPPEGVPKQNAMSKFGNGGRGCTGDPKGDCEHVLGWVKGFRIVRGRKGRKEDLLYPWQVTLEVLRTWKRLIVPCQHLQLYFQVMMGCAIGAFETVVVGYHAFSNNTQHYYVGRTSTRHRKALCDWTDDDRHQLMAMALKAGAAIDVHLEYETLGDVGSGYVKHCTGDVGVLETLTVIQTVGYDHLTLQPAMLLSCSYAYVFDESDFAQLLTKLMEKFLRPEVELEVIKAKQPGAMGGIRKAIPYVIRVKLPLPETTGLEECESADGDSSESCWTSDFE